MTLSTVTHLIGLDDCKIFEVTADSASSYTCGSAIDISGVKTLKLSLRVDEQELTGDNKILDIWSKVIGAEFELSFAKMDFSALAVILGADVVASGTTPSQKQTLSILGGNTASYFQLQGLILGTDTGSSVNSARLAVMKCKINAKDLLDASERGVQTFTMKGKASFTNKTFSRNSQTDNLLLDYVLAETAETISAITS